MALTLKHQNMADFLVGVRKRFKRAEKEEKCRIAAKIYRWYTDGDVTRAQLKDAFNLADNAEFAEWFDNKITRLRNLWRDLQAETAEGE